MGLSRLSNFFRTVRGYQIHVNPNSIDATDSIENDGSSESRPFISLQRALAEAARFSYQSGLNNDRFNRTTIFIHPGDYVIDNRPGLILDGTSFKERNGDTVLSYPEWKLSSNFDVNSPDNELYKLNSVFGGVIIPKGVSIVGSDLRKVKIRPKYVPDPENDNIDRSAIFRVTGATYFWQFSILDADINDVCYKNYISDTFVPSFSHHKLTAFEYADGVNPVYIQDSFYPSGLSINKTDLQMYYEKIGLAYGPSSGRPISPDYPSGIIDIQPKIDEYRIVGSKGKEVGITSIRAGDGATSSNTITVTLAEESNDFDIDTPIQIDGVSSTGYDGQYIISSKLDSKNIQYKVQNSPLVPLPTVANASIKISVDTVTSASPYIFNVSMRSVYGMCGLHADGNKASGFRSMIVAQFTGIGLQKDKNAFIKYNSNSGVYEDFTASGNENINTDSKAKYKPSYENYHIKCSNNAYLQLVSVFAIGFAKHFVSESGGDQSINNSNSNFGAKALISSGFRNEAFPRDDVGYITHIITPQEIESSEVSIEFPAIDVAETVSVANTSRLYLYNETNESSPPDNVIDGYRIGARKNDQLNVVITQSGISSTYSARIVMPITGDVSSEKTFTVGQNSVGINSITSNTLTLTSNHNLIQGESIRIISETGQLPDGIENNTVYYAITSGIGSNQLKIAQTLNNALESSAITINNNGGILSIVSRVSDKDSGDIGHPIQYDSIENQWYIQVSSASTERSLYNTIISLGTSGLGNATSRTYINRKKDSRSLADTIYRFRYVIPADSPVIARPPIDGFILQESNSSVGSTDNEVDYLYNTALKTLSNSTELRNPKYIASANWSGGKANLITELPHNLNVDSEVQILNITSTNNTLGTSNLGYNGTFKVIEVANSKQFSVSLSIDPGTFTNNTSIRTTKLPYFKRKKTPKNYYIYRSQEIQEYVPYQKDGIYHLYVLNSSVAPQVTPFDELNFSQPVSNLYPQTNRDNPTSNPKPTISFAVPDTIGKVVVNESQNSITRETLNSHISDTGIGIGITQIISNLVGTSHTIFTQLDHGFNRITSLTITNAGSNYLNGNYYNVNLVGFAGSTTGSYATARVTVSGGSISDIQIIDGGSAYGIGNTLGLVGVGTTTGNVPGYVTVNQVYNNVGNVLSLNGLYPSSYEGYNTLYKISSVQDSKKIIVSSASSISSPYTNGIGSTVASRGNLVLNGNSWNVSSLTYDSTTGISTVTTSSANGLYVGQKIYLNGANSSFFNRDFIIKKVSSLTSFNIDAGITTSNPVTTGTITVLPTSFDSNGGSLLQTNEKTSSRLNYEYAGITTTISNAISATTSSISISNIANFDFNIGDYLLIDNEIIRLSSTDTVNPVPVFRGVLGTQKTSHKNGSVIRRIKVLPVELRRNSLIRASNHTFEYLGFGPGNYSTALPEKQDRNLSPQEQLLSQSIKTDGGIVIFTAMNADGDFYTGNKRVNSSTGTEEVFDAPIPTVTGEAPNLGGVNIGFDVLTPLEASISRSLRVEGGPDSNLISQFDGPVVFNQKITSTSDKGIEANSLFLQGDQITSRKYTISSNKPELSGNVGDVVFDSSPSSGGLLGWVYTSNNLWERFGRIGTNGLEPFNTVGVSSNGTFVGLSTLINFVGTGLTISARNSSGITTISFQANPTVAISTGAFNTLVGNVQQLNFVGFGITVQGSSNVGIATISIPVVTVGGTNPGLPYNSIQFNDNGSFGGIPFAIYDNVNQKLNISNFTITNSGSVGINSNTPTSRFDIITNNDEAIYIKSTYGTGNIFRIDNTNSDTTPFIVNASGSVGINTETTIASLDVVGNAAITGQVRIYNNRSFYAGIQAPSLTSNVNLILPSSIGSANNILYTTGSGILDWISPSSLVALGATSSDSIPEGSTNRYFTSERAQDATGAAINAGSKNGIEVTYDDANNRINFNVLPPTPAPFTTRGFNIPI